MRIRFVRTIVGLGIMAIAPTAMALRSPDASHGATRAGMHQPAR